MRKINTSLPTYIDYGSISELISLIDSAKEDSEITWNSGGGLTGAGQVFISYLNNSEYKIDADVAGMAASMAAFTLPSLIIQKEQNSRI